jgi:hypothetical protein
VPSGAFLGSVTMRSIKIPHDHTKASNCRGGVRGLWPQVRASQGVAERTHGIALQAGLGRPFHQEKADSRTSPREEGREMRRETRGAAFGEDSRTNED